MIRVGIIGGAGYTAGELLRILLFHPNTDLKYVVSESHEGQPISEAHGDLFGDSNLIFAKTPHFEVDVIFLCMGHGKSREYLSKLQVPDTVRIIDLSTDFRQQDKGHEFIYGLPELNLNEIKSATQIANPGCFATCIQLGLLPLAENQLINHEVHIQAITGSSGAGVSQSATSHFSWRDSNLSIYKPFVHQHLEEINQSLAVLQKEYTPRLNFIPVRGNFTRGIFASMYTAYEGSIDQAREMYMQHYSDSAFTHVTDKNPDLKQVVNTNKCLIHLEVHEGKLLIISLIDNLLKGASGQAVQNMNIMFGLDQKAGLNLKGIGL